MTPGSRPSPTFSDLAASISRSRVVLVRLADGQQHAAGQAALAGAPVERLGDHRNAAIEVGVGHHDDEVLRAAERLNALAGVRAALIDEPRDRRRSDERHGANARVIADRLDDFLAAVDQIDDAGRQVALLEQLEHPLLRQRHLLRRLQDERVAADDRERQKPQRHHRRKVERRDRGADANRLAHRDAVDAARDVLEAVAHEHRRRAARDLDALDAAAQAAARFVQRLAVLGRDDARDLLEVLFEQLLELEHRLRALDRRRFAPARERLAAAATAASTSALARAACVR